MTKTAVVILNWNGLAFLKQFLKIVIRYSADLYTEVFVADNNSNDGSVEWIETNCPETRIIRLGKNLGYAGGYKKALENIEAEYFILLNSDVEVTEGWLGNIVTFMDANSDVAASQPKILSYNKRVTFEYAGAAGGFIDKYGYPFCRGRIINCIEDDTGQYDDYCDIFWASGACMAVRSSAYLNCGGLDEDFFAHMEEIDLCWRFQNAGYRISYIPGSVVYHVGGGTLPYGSYKKTYLNFRNNLFLLYKNLPEEKITGTLLSRMILDGLAALTFLLKGSTANFAAVFKAHIDFYRNLKNLKTKRRNAQNVTFQLHNKKILNKSIIFQFYIRGKKTWSSIY